MRVLFEGISDGEDIAHWQAFLLGAGFLKSSIDGKFGPKTKIATQEFQKIYGLTPDGIVGNNTYGYAMTMGFCVITNKSEIIDKYSSSWPPKPNFKHLSPTERESLFGKFNYKATPTKFNPEAITILGDWVGKNIKTIYIPQLKNVSYAPKNCEILWHKAGEKQIINMFKEWEDNSLLHLIKTWAGSWAPRFIRGSRSVLSNHSYASAFDINAPWNGLGRIPALVGKMGSVRELVQIANSNGFYWGGHWSGKSMDGMHFELAYLK